VDSSVQLKIELVEEAQARFVGAHKRYHECQERHQAMWLALTTSGPEVGINPDGWNAWLKLNVELDTYVEQCRRANDDLHDAKDQLEKTIVTAKLAEDYK
jgi:hypothetical protein